MCQSNFHRLIGPGNDDYGRNKNSYIRKLKLSNMQEIKIPTMGRTVILFPGKETKSIAFANGAEACPATVTQTFGGLAANMRAIPDSVENPLWFTSVPHVSEAPKDEEGNISGVYWAWPEIK